MANEKFLYNLSARVDANVGAAFQQFENKAKVAGDKAADSFKRAERSVDGVDRKLRAAAAGLAVFQGPLGGLASRVNATAQVFQFMGRSASLAIVAVGSFAAAINAASGVQQYQAKLVAATKTQGEFIKAQELAVLTARGSRSELGETIQFYVRLASATNGLNISQKELFNSIGTVQKSIQLSGVGAQEAAAAMQQFSQAIGSASGLSGDEFKSLGENANKVLQIIAEGLVKTNAIPGFDGTIGALRKLGSEGQLTSDKLLPALAKMQGSVDELFGRMPVTISQATNQLKTSLTQLVISTESAFGPLQKTANAIGFLAENFRLLGGVAVVVGTAVASRLVAPLVVAGVTAAATAARFGFLLVGLNGVVPAMLAQGIAANRLSIALRALLTPTNLVGAALTIAAGAAFIFSTRETQAEKATKLLGITQDELAQKVKAATGFILSQNDALRENIDLSSNKGVQDARRQIDTAKDSVDRARADLASTIRGAAITNATPGVGPGKLFDLAGQIEKGLDFKTVTRQLDDLRGKVPGIFNSRLNDINAAEEELAIATTALDEQGKRLVAAIDAKNGLGALNSQRLAKKSLFSSILSTGLDGKPLSSGTAKTKAQLDAAAAASAIDAGTQTLAAASTRRRKAIADLESSFGNIGKATADQQAEYSKQRAAIEERYRGEIDAIKSAAAAKKTAAAQDKLDRAARAAATRQDAADIETLDRIRQRYEKRINPNAQANADKLTVLGLARKDPSLDIATEFAAINAAIRQPLTDANIAAAELEATQRLILAGREAEAEVLQRANALVRAGVDASLIDLELIAKQVTGERQRNRQIELRGRLVENFARTAGEVKGVFTDFLSGGSIKNILPGLLSTFQKSLGNFLSDSIFGDPETDARNRMTGALDVNTTALKGLIKAISDAGSGISDGAVANATPIPGLAANDNFVGSQNTSVAAAQIAGVYGSRIGGLFGRTIGAFEGIADLFKTSTRTFKRAVDDVTGGGNRGAGDPFTNFVGATGKAGASIGNAFDKLFGGSGDGGGTLAKFGGSAGKAVGGVISGLGAGSQVLGVLEDLGLGLGSNAKRTTKTKQGAAGGAIIGFIAGGPLGAAIGAVIGGLVGSLFKTTNRAFKGISADEFGNVDKSGTRAKGDKQAEQIASANELASALLQTVGSLKDSLGANIAPGASLGEIGTYEGKFAFNSIFGPAGGVPQTFETASEALGAAIKSAIDNNIITGMRQGVKNLLTAGKDLEQQLTKAGKFNAVFDDLRRATDPAGFAVDELNRKFLDLANVFAEARASADDYAKLQQLYDLQRADALKTAGNATLASLKDYLTELTTSSGSGLSARDRRESALAAFTPFATDIAAGKSVDVDAYRTAAENLREVERELYGSTQGYFDRLSQITDLTKQAISGQSNVTSIADALTFNSPAQITPITNGLSELQQALLAQGVETNSLLAAILAGGGGGNDQFANLYGQRNF